MFYSKTTFFVFVLGSLFSFSGYAIWPDPYTAHGPHGGSVTFTPAQGPTGSDSYIYVGPRGNEASKSIGSIDGIDTYTYVGPQGNSLTRSDMGTFSAEGPNITSETDPVTGATSYYYNGTYGGTGYYDPKTNAVYYTGPAGASVDFNVENGFAEIAGPNGGYGFFNSEGGVGQYYGPNGGMLMVNTGTVKKGNPGEIAIMGPNGAIIETETMGYDPTTGTIEWYYRNPTTGVSGTVTASYNPETGRTDYSFTPEPSIVRNY